MTKLDPEALRARLNRAYDLGFSLRTIANRMSTAENALSSFRCGSRWGADRLARLSKALDEIMAEAEAEASET